MRKNNSSGYYAAAGIIAVMSVVLYLEGRIAWCKFGDGAIYINQAWRSSHTSQHVFDPYTFTHILHGIAYFWGARLIFRRLSISWRFAIAVAAAAVWEIFENSTFVIQRYRENTASLDYFGDTIANSIGDVIAAAVGFWTASILGKWGSLLLFIAVEVILLIWIRDSLLLNILMLIYPIESIRVWQMSLAG